MKINADALAVKYIAQLEKDLALERKRNEQNRADLEFYRGKCERLELSIMNSSPAPAAAGYAARSEPKRPSIGSVKLRESMRPMFSELQKKWNDLSAEEQAKAVAEGGFQFDKPESEAAK